MDVTTEKRLEIMTPGKLWWILLKLIFCHIWPKTNIILSWLWFCGENFPYSATLEDSLMVFYKTKHTLTWCSSCTLWYLLKKVENLHPHKNLHIDVYNSFIYIAKSWKQPRCASMGEWVNKLVHPDNGLLFSAKKKWATKPWQDMRET